LLQNNCFVSFFSSDMWQAKHSEHHEQRDGSAGTVGHLQMSSRHVLHSRIHRMVPRNGQRDRKTYQGKDIVLSTSRHLICFQNIKIGSFEKKLKTLSISLLSIYCNYQYIYLSFYHCIYSAIYRSNYLSTLLSYLIHFICLSHSF
jgi:hypothetical protein